MREREIVIRLRLPASLRRRWLPAAVAAIVSVGAVVYAAVPNVFSSGDPLSSTKVNANFSSLDSRVGVLEAKVPGGWTLGYCTTSSTTCTGGACPSGQRVLGGGCWPDSSVAITASYPSNNGGSGSQWVCRFASASTASIYWACGQ